MRDWLKSAFAAIILTLAALPAARADVVGLDAAADRADKAEAEFLDLAKGSQSTGAAPRASDPKAGPLLDALFDTGIVSGGHLTSLADLKAADRWAGAALRAGLVYVLAGTGLSDPAQMTGDPALTARINRNVVLYAPEVGRWLDASVVLQGGIIDAVTALAAGHPENAQAERGETMIRDGAEQGLKGTLTTLPIEGLDDRWRQDRLIVLAAFAGKASKMLLPAQCDAVRATIGSVRPALPDPAVRTDLDAVSEALRC